MTGSGKTYTMLGATDAYEKRGLIPRCMSFLFEEISKVGSPAADPPALADMLPALARPVNTPAPP